jgi:hypothetical protein
MITPCNFPIKNYTEIVYIFYKGNIPSFQCKMSLHRSTSTGEVDGPSLILIDLYVAALTPRLHCIEAALQLSENIALFVVSRQQRGLIGTLGLGRVSFMYKLYNVGARTEPCGTHLGVDNSFFTETANFLLDRYELTSLIKLVENCNVYSLYNKSGCNIVSKAFSMSRNTAAVDILLLKFRVT